MDGMGLAINDFEYSWMDEIKEISLKLEIGVSIDQFSHCLVEEEGSGIKTGHYINY